MDTARHTALRKLNGISIEQYSVVAEDNCFGTAYAVDLIIAEIARLWGHLLSRAEKDCRSPAIRVSTKQSDPFTAEAIACEQDEKKDTYGEGICFLRTERSDIFVGGSGIMGALCGAGILIRQLSDRADAMVSDTIEPMVRFPNFAKRIRDGREIRAGFIGDSVTFGYGAVVAWPILMAEMVELAYPESRLSICNAAESGTKSLWAAERIEELLLDSGYHDLVFIATGTNDRYALGYSPALTYEDSLQNYLSMIRQVRRANPESEIALVLIGRDFEAQALMGQGFEPSPFILAMVEAARQTGVPIIDPTSALAARCLKETPHDPFFTGWRTYMQHDDVHPNMDGQEFYAAVVWKYLTRQGP